MGFVFEGESLSGSAQIQGGLQGSQDQPGAQLGIEIAQGGSLLPTWLSRRLTWEVIQRLGVGGRVGGVFAVEGQWWSECL